MQKMHCTTNRRRPREDRRLTCAGGGYHAAARRRAARARSALWPGVKRIVRAIGRRALGAVPCSVRDIYYTVRGHYRGFQAPAGLSAEQCRLPPTDIDLADTTLVMPIDFMPDRCTLVGQRFDRSPHLEFVRDYLRGGGFDPRSTRYHRLARSGHLNCPAKGLSGADMFCVRFTELIERTKRGERLVSPRAPVVLIQYANEVFAVGDGKHRLAALLGLGHTDVCVSFVDAHEYRIVFGQRYAALRPRRFYEKTASWWEAVLPSRQRSHDRIEALKKNIRAQRLETWADVYHPIPFAGFEDLTTGVDPLASSSRLAMIIAHASPLQGKRVLDLGCNVGYYSHQLSRRGAVVTGIDRSGQYIEIAREVASLYELRESFKCADLTADFVKTLSDGYDLALCFSVLQWIVAQAGMAGGRALLREVSKRSESLFFDVAVNSGKSCLIAPPGDELRYVELMLRNSTEYRVIEHVGDVRPYGPGTARHVFYCTR